MRVARSVYREGSALEKRLRALVKEQSMFSREVSELRRRVAAAFADVLVLDPYFAIAKQVDSLIWTTVFYKVIADFRIKQRQLSSTKSPESNRAVLLLTSQFRYFLIDIQGFYIRLIRRLADVHELERVETMVLKRMEMESIEPDEDPSGHAPLTGVMEDKKKLYDMVQQCLIYLGDIARYRALYSGASKDPASHASSREFYELALLLDPFNGHPYNGLAVLATYDGDELAAAERYSRSLLSVRPLGLARPNLDLCLKKAREALQSTDIDMLASTFDRVRWRKVFLGTMGNVAANKIEGLADVMVILASHIPMLATSFPDDVPLAFSLLVAVPRLTDVASVHQPAREVSATWIQHLCRYVAAGMMVEVGQNGVPAVMSTLELALRWLSFDLRKASEIVSPDPSLWDSVCTALNAVADKFPGAGPKLAGPDMWRGYTVVESASNEGDDDWNAVPGRTVTEDMRVGRVLWWGIRITETQNPPLFVVGKSSKPGSQLFDSNISFSTQNQETEGEVGPKTGVEIASASISPDMMEVEIQAGSIPSPMFISESLLGNPEPAQSPTIQQGVVHNPWNEMPPRLSSPSRGSGGPPGLTPSPLSEHGKRPESPWILPDADDKTSAAQRERAVSPSKMPGLMGGADVATPADIAGSLLKGLAGIGSGQNWGMGRGSGWEGAPVIKNTDSRARISPLSGDSVSNPANLIAVEASEAEQRRRAQVLRDIDYPFGTGGSGGLLDAFRPYLASSGMLPPTDVLSTTPYPAPPPGLPRHSAPYVTGNEGSLERLGQDTMHLLGLEEDAGAQQVMSNWRGPGADITSGPDLPFTWSNPPAQAAISSVAPPLNPLSGITGLRSPAEIGLMPALPMSATLNEYAWPFGMPDQTQDLWQPPHQSSPQVPQLSDPIREFMKQMQSANRDS
ncbi:hypothetical protein HDU93_005929 [Gonapodya sp. JEL0774]|nr:hypothetical protein HDU93_005929 [Gonapodya sp. JEL0774]